MRGEIIILVMLFFMSCQRNDLVNMTTKEGNGYVSIIWEDRVYVPYSVISINKAGKQIGFVNSDTQDKVYEFRGYSTTEWIINAFHHDGAMLLREINVINIPSDLYSEYKWNNLK